MILGLFERLGVTAGEGFAHLHGLIEATKQAFMVRDEVVTDPAYMAAGVEGYLTGSALDGRARRIDRGQAQPWPARPAAGDTVWLGAVDREGRAVSYIQSIYWEYGSGVVLPETGILWQNRGCSFGIVPGAPHPIAPGRKPWNRWRPGICISSRTAQVGRSWGACRWGMPV